MKYYYGEHHDLPKSERVLYVRTGELRAPLKGEYYLSGAIPLAYRAPNNLSSAYHIMRPVSDRRSKQRRLV